MSLSNGILQYAPAVVEAAIAMEPSRTGCVVCLVSAGGAGRTELAYTDELFWDKFLGRGTFSADEKLGEWKYLSREKVSRAALNGDAVSSWRTRDRTKKQYGGGIIFQHNQVWYGLGVSGFSEDVDEAVAIILAILLRLVNDVETVRSFVAVSGNDKLIPLMKAVIGHSRDQELTTMLLQLEHVV